MNAEDLEEQVEKVIYAFAEDHGLHSWFRAYSDLPPADRDRELERLGAEMRTARKPHELIRATELLRDPKLFQGIAAVIEELRAACDAR